jgi:CRP/FNR family transcriptional regulator, cyclic AMP receptor protein
MDAERGFARIIESLPLATYRINDSVLAAGTKSGQLLILKTGAVAVLINSVEIARVEEPGAVFGELSVLLDQPHGADVVALEESQFYVADAGSLTKEPDVLIHVARILARRIVLANQSVLELRNQLQTSRPSGTLRGMIEKLQQILSIGGASYET